MAYTTIKKPSDYFNTKLYTGDGTSSNAITGVGFQPDWVWIKSRDLAYAHNLVDSVRGASNTLSSNSAGAENYAGTGDVLSFDSDGFSVRNTANWVINGSGNTYANWNWKANGTGVANTDGSISSTVSANTTSGFSIVSYTGNATTGATIGHGLGVTPDVIIAKSRASVEGWGFFHSSFSSQEYMFLNTTSPKGSASTVWNALPSSTVFTVGDNGSVNASGNMIAYCFAEKQGYSKFGSYIGNSGNNADAPFIYTGFKPAFFLVKNTAQASAWEMYDSKRLGYNDKNYQFRANESQGESATSDYVDFLSNGLKIRHQGGGINETGDTFIYMAFAEQPLVGDNPATAR